MSPSPGARSSIVDHYPEAVEWRRTLHRFPQAYWREFYSTAFIAEKLASWGYNVLLGEQVIARQARHTVPSQGTLEAEFARALHHGARQEYLEPTRGGLTGVVAILEGTQPGPTVAFRFDIDSLEVEESTDPSHRPASEGFASQNPGAAHMCGHDAHTATGLLLALYFAENREAIRGRVKFLFQPGEEDLAGAVPMIEKGHLDDVDYLFGAHVGLSLREVGQIALNVHSFLALSRFQVTYTGRSAHAGLRPNEGKNALLGACVAVTNLYAIARHGEGASRVNVGPFQSGTVSNVIPDRAVFWMETRGVTNEINGYMVDRAMEVLEGAARMYDLGMEIKQGASGISANNSPDLVALGTRVAASLPWVTEVVPEVAFNASEDVTAMIERVQQHGGKAMFGVIGTPTFGGHHSSTFDVDERVIMYAADFFAAMYEAVATKTT